MYRLASDWTLGMTSVEEDFSVLRMLGGKLCLDFANTVENRAGEHSEEFLHSYLDLIIWARRADLLADEDAHRLRELVERSPVQASRVFDQAIELREAIYCIFFAIACRDSPDQSDIKQVQCAYQQALGSAELIPDSGRFVWRWTPPAPRLDQILWPVALSAVELLTEGELHRVKLCANPHGCGWLFYDNSKNVSRRWCRMDGCGSQVKMRRYYAKRRSMKTGG